MLLGAAVLGGRLLRRIGALRPACRAGMKCLVRLFRLFNALVSWCFYEKGKSYFRHNGPCSATSNPFRGIPPSNSAAESARSVEALR